MRSILCDIPDFLTAFAVPFLLIDFFLPEESAMFVNGLWVGGVSELGVLNEVLPIEFWVDLDAQDQADGCK